MRVQVEFIGNDFRGEKRTFVRAIECPDFSPKIGRTTEMLGRTVKLPDISVEEQCDDWIGKHYDLTGVIHDEDLINLIDWKVLSPGEASETPEGKALMVIENLFDDNQQEIKTEFLVAYAHMRHAIHDLPVAKQVYITLSSLNLGLQASKVAYNRITKMLKHSSSDEVQASHRRNFLGKNDRT